MPDAATIAEAAATAKRVTVQDTVSVEQRPISELIAAAEFAQRATAQTKNPFQSVARARLAHGGPLR